MFSFVQTRKQVCVGDKRMIIFSHGIAGCGVVSLLLQLIWRLGMSGLRLIKVSNIGRFNE